MTTIEDAVDWAPEPEEYAVIEAKLTCPPRLFALCELERDEEGELIDGGVLAWGMEFDHRAELVSSDGGGRGSFGSADRAARLFAHTGEVRLVRPEPVVA